MKTKNIYFIQGSHGVGKSTLIKDYLLRQDSKKYLTIDGVARNLKSKGVSNDKSTKLLDYYHYYDSYLNAYNQYILSDNFSYEKIFFIRSVLDVIIYSRLNKNCKSYPQIGKLGIEIFNSIRHKVDKIIYIPIEIQLIDDGIRNNSKTFQKMFDIEQLRLFEELKIDYFTLNGSFENRLYCLENLIKNE